MLKINSNDCLKTSFKKNDKPKWCQNVSYSAMEFLSDAKKLEEKRVNGDFFSKNMGSFTATYGGAGAIIAGELVLIGIVKNKKKNLTPQLKQAFNKKIRLALAGILAVGVGIMAVIQKWQNKLMTKESDLAEKYLKEIKRKADILNNNIVYQLLNSQ